MEKLGKHCQISSSSDLSQRSKYPQHLYSIENEVWLIDFDKCGIEQGSNWKNSNMERLKRSFEKEKRLRNIYWQLADWQILTSAYNEAAIAN